MSFVSTPSLEALRTRLLASLEDEPLEDGMTHPAEELLREAILSYPKETEEWLAHILPTRAPSTQAGLLQCLGRLQLRGAFPAGEWLAMQGLSSAAVEVREAAISVAEQWGTPVLVEALRRHQEVTPWLSKYASKVLRDLGG